jgi:hypothetical protein
MQRGHSTCSSPLWFKTDMVPLLLRTPIKSLRSPGEKCGLVGPGTAPDQGQLEGNLRQIYNICQNFVGGFCGSGAVSGADSRGACAPMGSEIRRDVAEPPAPLCADFNLQPLLLYFMQ